jgi:hypothetical protein
MMPRRRGPSVADHQPGVPRGDTDRIDHRPRPAISSVSAPGPGSTASQAASGAVTDRLTVFREFSATRALATPASHGLSPPRTSISADAGRTATAQQRAHRCRPLHRLRAVLERQQTRAASALHAGKPPPPPGWSPWPVSGAEPSPGHAKVGGESREKLRALPGPAGPDPLWWTVELRRGRWHLGPRRRPPTPVVAGASAPRAPATSA